MTVRGKLFLRVVIAWYELKRRPHLLVSPIGDAHDAAVTPLPAGTADEAERNLDAYIDALNSEAAKK